jgi:hypothetical protein
MKLSAYDYNKGNEKTFEGAELTEMKDSAIPI